MKKVLQSLVVLGFVFVCVGMNFELVAQGQDSGVKLHWLKDQAPDVPAGVSWGVPFPQGEVKKGIQFTLATANGSRLPVQSWPTAYWPDGSLKWVGLATTVDTTNEGPLTLSVVEKKEEANQLDSPLSVEREDGQIKIKNGTMATHLAERGRSLIDSIVVDGRKVAGSARLVAIHQEGPGEDVLNPPNREKTVSRIDSVRIEQDGPVRAVIRFDGRHQAVQGTLEWLPFTVRLYFYADSNPVKMVHSFTYDGNQQQDFIKGLGLQFDVPMREQVHNRHIRFSGKDQGLWAEPVKPLASRRRISYQDESVYPAQEKGNRVPNVEEFEPPVQGLINDLADWNDFKLVQESPDGFTIQKRTSPKGQWIAAGAGTRASGFAFVGDVSGGLGVGLQNFWQTYPSHLEINDATKDVATLNVWMWSPEAPAMDMRHYDTEAHGLQASYEDVQEGFSIANGVARTHVLTLFPEGSVASHKKYATKSNVSQNPPLLTASPEYLHSANVFGVWSLPDRSSPGKRWIEDKLDAAIEVYQKEIEQRRWYGFWDYGDVMHSYDGVRHKWRYDVGGFAWANSELVPDMWLWYSYLRTGREDIFRMAEAMTRHTGEVDVYHSGRFEDLGTRHNVIHWGDGAKEARISQAALRRFYYYLTTDERTGDLMHNVSDTEESYTKLDPMRKAMPADEYPTEAPTRLRVGPDWLALAGNWMTAWERTGDEKYLEKIKNGFDSIASMRYGLFSGPGVLGFYPETGRLLNDTAQPYDHHTSHLLMIMGGAEVLFELTDLIDHEGFEETFLNYSRLYSIPQDSPDRSSSDGTVGDGNFKSWHARLTAYAAVQLDDPKLAERAWKDFLGNSGWPKPEQRFETINISGPEVLHPMEVSPWTSTNETAQWCLNAIQILELIENQMPEKHPAWN
ncbi:hypothetical protein [Fodinibius salsisoli]|uniref:Tat pathway signal sequence domain protein n=1 Tax=Fodinibius salsisoli TaxID=2820877 RepID=A0ABT3PHB0_9BACT|nr:hypothetical protein [Fodinibius salsisoli]MCW9705300.1 hypothetical protein [Fodinibius salsisoli]